MLLLAALQLNILKSAKNHHFPNTEINNRVGDGTRSGTCAFVDVHTRWRMWGPCRLCKIVRSNYCKTNQISKQYVSTYHYHLQTQITLHQNLRAADFKIALDQVDHGEYSSRYENFPVSMLRSRDRLEQKKMRSTINFLNEMSFQQSIQTYPKISSDC